LSLSRYFGRDLFEGSNAEILASLIDYREERKTEEPILELEGLLDLFYIEGSKSIPSLLYCFKDSSFSGGKNVGINSLVIGRSILGNLLKTVTKG
jgi:hypothetical protein